MMKRTARVVAVSDDAFWVEAVADAGCGSCARPGGCGSLSAARRNALRIRFPLTDHAAAPLLDERVEIGMPEAAMLREAAISWLLPLGGLLVGAVIAERWVALPGGDIASMAGALAGFALAMMAARLISSRVEPLPELLRVVSAADQAS